VALDAAALRPPGQENPNWQAARGLQPRRLLARLTGRMPFVRARRIVPNKRSSYPSLRTWSRVTRAIRSFECGPDHSRKQVFGVRRVTSLGEQGITEGSVFADEGNTGFLDERSPRGGHDVGMFGGVRHGGQAWRAAR